MDAPPTYDEAIAGKSQSGAVPNVPLISKPTGPAPAYNPYYPSSGPIGSPGGLGYAAPPSMHHQPYHSVSYQEPQMMTVTMVPTTTTRTVIVENMPRVRVDRLTEEFL